MEEQGIFQRQPYLIIIIPLIAIFIILATIIVFYVDFESPSQVTGLTLTDEHDGNLYLDWDDATDDLGIVKYYIYRNNVKLSYEPVNSYYNDTNVSVGQTYNYCVSAVDVDNYEGPKSINVTGEPSFAYTDLSIFDSNHENENYPLNLVVGQDGNVIIAVNCNEHEVTNYTIKIKLTEDTSIDNNIEYTSTWNQAYALNPNDAIYRNITLEHNESFEDSFSFNALQAGAYKFEVFLYNQDTNDPHKIVYLWITVT